MNVRLKIQTALSLGLVNIARVFIYKIGVKFGFNRVRRLKATLEQGIFFRVEFVNSEALEENSQWFDQQFYFGSIVKKTTDIPNWHQSVLTGISVHKPDRPWWAIPDFDAEVGDIKGVWEASRFDWVVCFAQGAANGKAEYLARLNNWLCDWCDNNQPYSGVNWKCGQEASFRVMHLAVAAIILKQMFLPESALASLIRVHLQRIAPTMSYAIAQDNNHGTSEAAALFIGGSWLAQVGDNEGHKWLRLGREWLENRAEHLIEEDGSFSQYSVIYHRVMLDTYSLAEVWRSNLRISPFSSHLYEKMSASTNWLYQFTQESNGNAPNLGGNDGARLLPLIGTDYRDFRPSVQLASVLFRGAKAWKLDGEWNLPLKWLGVKLPNRISEPQCSVQFKNGGYSILRNRKAFVLLNYPQFRFRPCQSDSLHVDFWVAGENLLRDAGTYSYNADDDSIHYFGGVESHNTIQFDDRDQMPRLSRFLFGGWLKSKKVLSIKKVGSLQRCSAAYTNSFEVEHERCVTLDEGSLTVRDSFSGFKDKAILRWRLRPGDWVLEGSTVKCSLDSLGISTTMPIKRIQLIEGWESLYYYQKSVLPVLEVEVTQPGTITSVYRYN